MRILAEELVGDVLVALDENGASEELRSEGDRDTLMLDGLVGSKLVEATRRIHMEAPYQMVEGGHNGGDSVVWDSDGSGRIVLPRDFLRLVVLQMSDWERPVYKLKRATDASYLRQGSRYKGIRGTSRRPEAYLVHDPEGLAIEFHASKTGGASVRHFSYLPEPRIDVDGYIDVCPLCRRAVVYLAGSFAAASLREWELMKNMAILAKEMITE